jgi:hypothetical protein
MGAVLTSRNGGGGIIFPSMRSLGILFIVHDITLSTLGKQSRELEMGRRYNYMELGIVFY